ncbi:hypothetical protein GCM10009789_28610 [Kribbella sancticallisti]|uniref:Uncharacterized protein n=1 Tax=Kribbella sancticallisti TaxID=460087 RepID=A0ABP4P9D1_9ACTN
MVACHRQLVEHRHASCAWGVVLDRLFAGSRSPGDWSGVWVGLDEPEHELGCVVGYGLDADGANPGAER